MSEPFSSLPKGCLDPRPRGSVQASKHILSFTEREPLVHDMKALFSTTQQILVEVDKDLNWSFMARLPHDTPNTMITTQKVLFYSLL